MGEVVILRGVFNSEESIQAEVPMTLPGGTVEVPLTQTPAFLVTMSVVSVGVMLLLLFVSLRFKGYLLAAVRRENTTVPDTYENTSSQPLRQFQGENTQTATSTPIRFDRETYDHIAL